MVAASNGAVGVAEVLIEAGADVNRLSTRGVSALCFAASRSGYLPGVELLQTRRADPLILGPSADGVPGFTAFWTLRPQQQVQSVR